MKKRQGYILIEILIGMGIFVLSVSATLFWIIDSLEARRLGEERAFALAMAEEGLEATKTIRDDSFAGVTTGNHGLIISGTGRWIFSGTSDSFGSFVRTITVVDSGSLRVDVTSRVTWPFSPQRNEMVTLMTRLASWR